jgi:hypothetical protein
MAAILVQAAIKAVTAVEGHRAELEQQPDADQTHPGQPKGRAVLAGAQCDVDLAQGERTGVAVEQRRAVEEEGRRQGAEQEVLQGRLLGQQPSPAGQAAEQIERQRQDLQRHEHGDQVVGRREEHHPRQREQSQREDLGVLRPVLDRLPLGRRARDGRGLRRERAGAVDRALGEQQERHTAEHQQDGPDEVRRPVQGEGVLRDDGFAPAGPVRHGGG